MMPALVAGIHVFPIVKNKTWMAGTSPARTEMASSNILPTMVRASKIQTTQPSTKPAHDEAGVGSGFAQPAAGTIPMLRNCHEPFAPCAAAPP
jgi:hypothetical protein